MSKSKNDSNPKGQKPALSLRRKGVHVSVFENQGERDGRATTFFKASLQRVYKDGDEFKTTPHLGRDDLPVASLLLQKAWEFILEKEANRAPQEAET